MFDSWLILICRQDIIENEDIKLDKMFIASLVHDLIKGMLYIHNSMLICHGNLKSSNCVVTSRWVLQVTDFGLSEMRHCAETESIGEHQHYRSKHTCQSVSYKPFCIVLIFRSVLESARDTEKSHHVYKGHTEGGRVRFCYYFVRDNRKERSIWNNRI